MKLFIKPHSDVAQEYYRNHGHFHEGDAGLDLYVLEEIHFDAGETRAIKMGISCEPEDGKSYYLLPRSSISKRHLGWQIPLVSLMVDIGEKLWLFVTILKLKVIL